MAISLWVNTLINDDQTRTSLWKYREQQARQKSAEQEGATLQHNTPHKYSRAPFPLVPQHSCAAEGQHHLQMQPHVEVVQEPTCWVTLCIPKQALKEATVQQQQLKGGALASAGHPLLAIGSTKTEPLNRPVHKSFARTPLRDPLDPPPPPSPPLPLFPLPSAAPQTPIQQPVAGTPRALLSPAHHIAVGDHSTIFGTGALIKDEAASMLATSWEYPGYPSEPVHGHQVQANLIQQALPPLRPVKQPPIKMPAQFLPLLH